MRRKTHSHNTNTQQHAALVSECVFLKLCRLLKRKQIYHCVNLFLSVCSSKGAYARKTHILYREIAALPHSSCRFVFQNHQFSMLQIVVISFMRWTFVHEKRAGRCKMVLLSFCENNYVLNSHWCKSSQYLQFSSNCFRLFFIKFYMKLKIELSRTKLTYSNRNGTCV